MKGSLWQPVINVKSTSPLVQNITNYVVMNNTANALLAVGASPIMAHAHNEMEEMVGICNALVVNIGTLDEYWLTSMQLAAGKANQLKKLWVLDPVGAGATTLRNNAITSLLAFKPSVIRGNASEIMAIASANALKTKGVDSVYESTEAIAAAEWLHKTTGSIICISGEVDVIISSGHKILLKNGHPIMQKVTGMGCTATALIGAFAASNPGNLALAVAAAVSLLNIAGEIAQKISHGPGTFQANLLDKLYTLTEEEFYEHLRIEITHE